MGKKLEPDKRDTRDTTRVSKHIENKEMEDVDLLEIIGDLC